MTTAVEARHALIVATARYTDPKLRQLRAPAADADRLAEVLRDPTKGNFQVEVLVDETHAVLTRRIASFFRDRRPGDLLLLHFSCHGIKDERGDLYLAAADTEFNLLSATAVSAAWLNDQISRTRSKRTVVLLDCCYSGSFPFGMRAKADSAVHAPEQFEGRGRAIITASSGMEYAYEGDHLEGEGRPSIFTEAVVEGLQTGKADLDHDRLVSVDDLYGYVYDRVRETTPDQTPNKKSEIEGPLYLARSSYRPEIDPARLDPELLARTEDRYAGIRVGAVQELTALLRASDPAVALAARVALSKLLDDDSRQVSASAEAALAAPQHALPEQTAAEDMTSERPDDGLREADRPPREPATAVSASEVPDDAGRHRPPDIAATGRPRRERPEARWPRRHPRLTAAFATLVVAVGVIIAVQSGAGENGEGGGSGSSSDYQTLVSLLPSSIQPNCSEDPEQQWMVNDQGADAQASCEDPNGYLTYGLWPSASKARRWFSGAEPGVRPCSEHTQTQMRQTLPHGASACGDNPQTNPDTGLDKGILFAWNEDRSRVAGFFQLIDSRDQDAALKGWKMVVKAE